MCVNCAKRNKRSSWRFSSSSTCSSHCMCADCKKCFCCVKGCFIRITCRHSKTTNTIHPSSSPPLVPSGGIRKCNRSILHISKSLPHRYLPLRCHKCSILVGLQVREDIPRRQVTNINTDAATALAVAATGWRSMVPPPFGAGMPLNVPQHVLPFLTGLQLPPTAVAPWQLPPTSTAPLHLPTTTPPGQKGLAPTGVPVPVPATVRDL